jgi:hypothetical protein
MVFWASRIRVHEEGVRGQAPIRVHRELSGATFRLGFSAIWGFFLDIILGFDERLHEVKLKLGFSKFRLVIKLRM